jgi:hypothetical protein
MTLWQADDRHEHVAVGDDCIENQTHVTVRRFAMTSSQAEKAWYRMEGEMQICRC